MIMIDHSIQEVRDIFDGYLKIIHEDVENVENVKNVEETNNIKTLPISKECLCQLCGKVFKNNFHFYQHQYQVHPTKQNQFSCKFCNMQFVHKFVMTKHINRVHSNNKFDCKLCSKTFTTNYNLKRHLKSTHPLLCL